MTTSTSKLPTLPDDPIAALLLHGGGTLDMDELARRISSGQWPINPGVTHQGLNLIELLTSNECLIVNTQETLSLIVALSHAGVEIAQDAWKRVSMSLAPSVALMLRCCAEGENVDTAHGACAALDWISPITPVIERSAKALEAVRRAGGWGCRIQGVSLATWLASHDDYISRGGYTQKPHLNEGEQQSLFRVRTRLFEDALKTHNQWLASPLDKVMLYCRTDPRDICGDNTESENVRPGAISRALPELDSAPPRIQAIVAGRLCDSLITKVASKPSGIVDVEKLAVHIEEIMDTLKRMLAHPVEIGIAGNDLLKAVLLNDPRMVERLPANRTSVSRIINILMNGEGIGRTNSGGIVRSWVSHDPNLQKIAIGQAQKFIKEYSVGFTPLRRIAGYEAFILSLGAPLTEPASSRSSPRL